MGSAHRAGWFRGEFYMPLPGAAKTVQPGFAQWVADWRSGPRWSILSVLSPVHPFPLRGTSPQGETRDMERKTGESYTSMYHFGVFPLWWLSPPPCPVGSMSYDTERKSRNADFISIARRAIRNPQRRRRCRPLSEANTTLRHNLRRQPRPFFKNLRRSRHHNPRAQRARQT